MKGIVKRVGAMRELSKSEMEMAKAISEFPTMMDFDKVLPEKGSHRKHREMLGRHKAKKKRRK